MNKILTLALVLGMATQVVLADEITPTEEVVVEEVATSTEDTATTTEDVATATDPVEETATTTDDEVEDTETPDEEVATTTEEVVPFSSTSGGCLNCHRSAVVKEKARTPSVEDLWEQIRALDPTLYAVLKAILG